MSTRVRTVALAGVVAMLFSVPTAETGLAARVAPAPSPVAQSSGRIAYAATGHRSLGQVASTSSSVPLFGGGPEHFDEQASARGDLLVFTSLRDEPKPQVYLRDAGGAVRRLTTNRDAAHPSLSPDGRLVVFDSAEQGNQGAATQRDLWLVGSDGSGLRRLTDTAADETSPTVSPDGTSVAFSSNRDPALGKQIYQQPLAGGQVTRVTNEPSGAAVEPAWNPVDDAAHRELIAYTLDTGGRSGQRVRLTDTQGHQGPLLNGVQASWQTRSPTWLPDGDGVLFLRLRQLCGCAVNTFDRVYRSAVRSEAAPQLVLAEDRAVDAPTWLGPQDGGAVVVARTSAPQRNIATLQDIRPDGTDPRDLGLTVLHEDPSTDPTTDTLFNPAPGFDPWTERQNYSPDGRKIVVTRFEDSAAGRIERIWVVNADGSAARPLGLAGRGPTDWDTDPTFSPDGRLLAFARKSPGGVGQGGGPSRVMIADVASGAIVGSVPPSPDQRATNDAQPTWSSDGTMLAFTRDAVINDTGGNKHIWTVPVSSLNQQRDLSATICPGDCEVIDDSPAFSPDGRTVAFNRKDGAGRVNERDGVLIASLTGGGCQVALPAGLRQNPAACEQELPDTSTTGPFQPRDVAWSADAKRLVLTSRRAVARNSPEGLSIYDIATGALAPLDWRLPGRQKEPSVQQSVDLNLTAPRSVRTQHVGGSARITATVVNRGPAPSPGTAITVAVPSGLRLSGLRTERGRCTPAAMRCDLGILEPGATVRVTADVVGTKPGRALVNWSVSGAVLDPTPQDDTAVTVVPVGVAEPGLTVTARPNPGFVGGSVTLTYTVRNGNRNANKTLATGLRLRLGLPGGMPVDPLPPGCSKTECTLPDLPPGTSSVLHVVLRPKAPSRTTVVASVRTTGTDANPNNNVARVPLRILQPRIVAVPSVGKPGFVTLVRGVDFPAGSRVRLAWRPGITAAAAPTVPGGNGRFTAQLLILGKDQTGPRTITASGPGFSQVSTSFLVVTGTIGPPDEVERR